MEYQVTCFCDNGKYKPVSCIVKVSERVDLNDREEKVALISKGVSKICKEKGWDGGHLKKYGYSKFKVREHQSLEQQDEFYALLKAMRKMSAERQGE